MTTTAPTHSADRTARNRAAAPRELRAAASGSSGTGKPTDLFHAVTGAKIAEATTERHRLQGDGRVRDARRRAGAAAHDLPRARADAQGDGAAPDGAEGRVLSRLRRHRRDEAGLVGRHRGRHRNLLRLRVARAARVPERDASTSTGRRRRCRRAARSSGGTSACRSRASRSTSTRSTSPCGECWRSSRRRCSPACRRS